MGIAPDGGRQVKLLQMKIFLAASQKKAKNLRGVEKLTSVSWQTTPRTFYHTWSSNMAAQM